MSVLRHGLQVFRTIAQTIAHLGPLVGCGAFMARVQYRRSFLRACYDGRYLRDSGGASARRFS